MASMIRRRDCDEEHSTITDKGDIGFIDLRVAMLDCIHVENEKGPVQVSYPFSFDEYDQPRSGHLGENITDPFTITNTTDQPIDLWKVSIYDSKPRESFTLSLGRPPLEQKHENGLYPEVFSIEDRFLQPGKPLEVWLTCKPKDIGMHTAVVHVQIDVDEIIERVVFVLAEDEISESLNPNSHYDFKLYRDHPYFLHLPPSYQGKLLACKGDGARFSSVFGVPLGEKSFTVFFTGIIGLDETVGLSSWFNRFEASKTVEIIRHLTKEEVSGQDQIAVITPFKEHKLKIKKALRSIGMPNIQVGIADQLQSREKQVVVVSIARSTMKYNYFDRTNCRGLLYNRRRFNAAITAARSLLIVIGNPHIVCKDLYWSKLLWYCVDNGAYEGCYLPERPTCSTT